MLKYRVKMPVFVSHFPIHLVLLSNNVNIYFKAVKETLALKLYFSLLKLKLLKGLS